MKFSRRLIGLVPPYLCAAMVTCILAAFLFNRHNHQMSGGLTVPWVIAPYVVVGVVSYLVRNNAVAFVFALIFTIGITVWSPLPVLLFYDGTNATGMGMGLGLHPLLQWEVIGAATGAALVVMLVHKLWQLSMTRPLSSRVAWGTAGAVFGAVGGIAVVIVMKAVAFDVVGELTGAVIAAGVGAIVGGLLRSMNTWPARTIGGGMGGAVGGLYVVGLAEDFLPQGADWAFYGSLGAALFAVPTAAVVGTVVGLLCELFSGIQNWTE